MNCPYCEKEMKKGIVKVSGSVPISYNIAWFPEEERKKIFKNKLISLSSVSDGYHCDNCKKVIAILEEKQSYL